VVKRGGEGVLDERRRDGLAGTAPDGEGVEDDNVVLLEGSLELGLAVAGEAMVSACLGSAGTGGGR
jgi:hypothetical protein